MELQEAIEKAKSYNKDKRAIRKALLTEARRIASHVWNREQQERFVGERRKLFGYPSDLSETKLLGIIDGSILRKEEK